MRQPPSHSKSDLVERQRRPATTDDEMGCAGAVATGAPTKSLSFRDTNVTFIVANFADRASPPDGVEMHAPHRWQLFAAEPGVVNLLNPRPGRAFDPRR
jgi:hypothetical protein